MLGVPVPAALRGGRVIAIQLQLPSNEQRSAAHGGAEGRNAAKGFAGLLVLGPLSAVTPAGVVRLAPLAAWRGSGGLDVRPAGDSLALRYVIDTSEQAALRPRQPFDARRLPVVASPDVAASAGASRTLELSFGGQVVHARLVAVARRFPTTQDSGDSFVVADESSLAAALGADDLPASIPDELWLSTPQAASAQVAATLRKPPFAVLDVSSRAAIHAELQNDPIARGIVSSLVAAALAALALALLGVALATLGFLRDEGDSLFDLESQGAGPRALRACVRWRALGLALLGVLAGVGSRHRAGRRNRPPAGRRRHARGAGSAAPAHHAVAHDRGSRGRARAARRRARRGRRCTSPTAAASAGRGVTGEQWAE